MDDKKCKIYLIIGSIPYIILIICAIYHMIFGIEGCIISLGAETNCSDVYGLKALLILGFEVLVLCIVYWYISLPIFVITLYLLDKGLKYRKSKKKNKNTK